MNFTSKLPIWDDPAVTSLNRAPVHSAWGAYESAEQAAGYNRSTSHHVSDLNGVYDFCLVSCPEDAGEFYLPNADVSAFAPIQVPGAWELQGHDVPIHTNIPYPWPMAEGERGTLKAKEDGTLLFNPPNTPAQNPTGCYRKTFVLSKESLSRELFLRLDGVGTAFLLWINGQFVGYGEDARLPSEFNVTSFLNEGENLLALQVMRFASCSWMEDQDGWYLSGIHRGVSLISKPAMRLQDWHITATPNLHTGAGYLQAKVQVPHVPGFADYRVRVALFSPEKELLHMAEADFAVEGAYALSEGPVSGWAQVEITLTHAELWSPDTPVLYTVVMTLLDAQGNEIDFENDRIGFRKVEVVNGVVRFNGKRLVVRGVNRHEFGPNGYTVDEALMRREIALMKKLNINAVRTCHYPCQQLWYDLCDELGLLVVSECNIETHGVAGRISCDAEYAAAYLERATRMVRTLKNHTCIYAWSLGNESGHGANHGAMYGFIKEYDKTRLCQYESAFPKANISDIRGLMYAPVETIHDMLCDTEDTRPIILVELSYQISNTGGGLAQFRRLTDSYTRFQGGFIWDWADKTLTVVRDGITFHGYGGDFGEKTFNSLPFMVANGILFPDLTPKPAAYDMQQVFAPLWIERRDGVHTWETRFQWNRYVLKNDSFALSSEYFTLTAVLTEDGREVQRVLLPVPTAAPEGEAEFEYIPAYEKQAGCEYAVTFHLTLKSSDDAMFTAQFPLESIAAESAPAVLISDTDANCVQTENTYELTAGKWKLYIERAGGQMTLSHGGQRLLWGGLPCYSRPITGLDCCDEWGWQEETFPMAQANPVVVRDSVTASKTEAAVTIDFNIESTLGRPLTARVTYRLTGAGAEVEFTSAASGGWRALPRAGLEFFALPYLETLDFYGYGPYECYSDRMESAVLGVFRSTTAAEHVPYIPPSENGGHEGTRWLTLTNAEVGLRFDGASPFHFDVRHDTLADYRAAKHDHELPGGQLVLHLDAAHSPIGGHMAWCTDVDSREMLGDGLYSQRFTITKV